MCGKARAEGVVTNSFSFFLKSQGGEYRRTECRLPDFTASPSVIIPVIRSLFHKIYSDELVYRACGVTIMGLRSNTVVQEDLFGNAQRGSAVREVDHVADVLNRRYGEHSVMLASSLGGRVESPGGIGEALPLVYLGEVG